MVGRGITPLWRHRQREQFARAVDAHPDPADEKALADELAVVALLRKAAATAGPDEAAKARMRARVLGAAADPSTPAKPTSPARLTSAATASAHPGRRRPRSGARGRLAVALAAALCLLFSLTGMSLLLSQDALPGDALYGVKRSAESASLGLTFGEESKGHKRLEFAAARIAEIETLADRYHESGGGPLGGYLTALTDFDANAAAGSRVLAAFGSNSDQRALDELGEWATTQATRLAELRPALPAEVGGRADTSLDLLGRIAERATALRARMGCGSVTSGQFDQVGPVPDPGECVPPPVASSTPTQTSPEPSVPVSVPAPVPAPPTTSSGSVAGSTSDTTSAGGVPTGSVPPPTTTTTDGQVLPLPTLTLPSLPLPGLGG